MTNLSPLDLWDYVHGFGHKLEIKSKSRTYTPSNNICLWRLLHVIVGVGHQEGAGKWDVRESYEIYERYEIYENATKFQPQYYDSQ